MKKDLSEYKRNMKIGAVATAVGLAMDVGISNLHIHDLSVLSIMSSFVVVPGMIVAINANDYIKTKKRINEIENTKALKKIKAN